MLVHTNFFHSSPKKQSVNKGSCGYPILYNVDNCKRINTSKGKQQFYVQYQSLLCLQNYGLYPPLGISPCIFLYVSSNILLLIGPHLQALPRYLSFILFLYCHLFPHFIISNSYVDRANILCCFFTSPHLSNQKSPLRPTRGFLNTRTY